MSLGEFRENFADVTGIRSDIEHAREQSREQHLRENEEKLGLASGSIESISRYAKHLERHNNEVRGRGLGKKSDLVMDTFLLSLLDQGDLDLFVAENVFGGMNDEQIMEAVNQIEAETGKNFPEYAKEVLGDDMPQRQPGESDADYYRRLLIQMGDVMLNDDLTFKPGYEDNPVARIIRGSAEYADTVEKTRSIVAARANNATIEEVAKELVPISENPMKADFARAVVPTEDEEVTAVIEDGYNSQMDETFDKDAPKTTSTADFLNGMS